MARISMTHDEFIKKYQNKFSDNIEILGKYNNWSSKILIRCKICGKEYYSLPDSIVKGRQHISCQGYTHNQFIKKFSTQFNKNIIVIGKYKNANTPILIKCNCCNKTSKMYPSSLIRGSKCEYCRRSAFKKNNPNKKMSHKEFLEKWGNNINKNIKMLSKYDGSSKKITVQCLLCGEVFNMHTSSIIKGCGCKKCSVSAANKKRTMTEEDFMKKYSNNFSKDITIIGKYINYETKILVKCNICGEEYHVDPESLANGCAHASCQMKKVAQKNTISIDLFKHDLDKIHPNEYEIVGEYRGTSKPLKIKHKCGNIYEVGAANQLLRSGCPFCNIKSIGEEYIKKYLELNNIKYQIEYRFNDCKNKHTLPFDFAILNEDDSVKFLIEYDGEQHFTPIEFFGGASALNSLKERDKIKTEYCQKNNIKLLRISYLDYNNIEKILNREFCK